MFFATTSRALASSSGKLTWTGRRVGGAALRAGLVAAAFCMPMLWFSQNSDAAQSYTLVSSRPPGEVSRVKISFDVQGDLHPTKLPDAKQADAKQTDQKSPLRVAARLMYDEMLAPKSGTPSTTSPADRTVARYYHQAQAQMGIGTSKQRSDLRPDRRLIVAQPNSGNLTIFSPAGPLTREELDLIDLPANSHLVYGLLPDRPVQIGQTWEHDGHLFAKMARVESVKSSQIKSTLGAVQGNVARVGLKGTLRGRGAGAETELEISGEYRYDLRQRRITWLQVTINERRSPGHTMPGLQVKGDLRMLVTPSEEAGPLGDTDWSNLLALPGPARELLQLVPARGGFEVTLDRRWHVMSDSSDGVVLRFVDSGDLLAQCNISDLTPLPTGKQVGLEAFQQDVRRAIGERFEQFEHASQGEDDAGRRLLRVAAVGRVEDIPIRWVYYHISNEAGRRAAQVFTMEAELAERLGDAEHQLVGGFQFAEQNQTAQARSTASTKPTAKPISAQKSPAASNRQTGRARAAAKR